MIKNSIELIDETVFEIKRKNYNLSFSKRAIYLFELELFFCLELVRYELFAFGNISDDLSSALKNIFSIPIFEFYYRDYPMLYEKCRNVFEDLSQYNSKFKSDELATMKSGQENWRRFFKRIISKLLVDQ